MNLRILLTRGKKTNAFIGWLQTHRIRLVLSEREVTVKIWLFIRWQSDQRVFKPT